MLCASWSPLLAASNEPIEPSPISADAPESQRTQVAHQPKEGKTEQRTAIPTISTPHEIATPSQDGNKKGEGDEAREAKYTGIGVIIAAVALIVSIFGYLASKDAAKAARDSADAAVLALKADRPYVLIATASISGFPPEPAKGLVDPGNALTLAKFVLRNFGKGPAIIDEIKIKLKPVETWPAPKDYSDCRDWPEVVEAISSGEPLKIESDFMDGWLSNPEIEAVTDRVKTLIAYGRVKYRDVFDKLYETGFFWLVYVPPKNQFIAGEKLIPAPPYLYRKRDDPSDKERNYCT